MFRLHQDVKPQNILVVSNEHELPYEWQFKLGDLGLSHFEKLSSLQDGAAIDAQGTRTYGKCINLSNKGLLA
jgi:serine/threonine protein kinase